MGKRLKKGLERAFDEVLDVQKAFRVFELVHMLHQTPHLPFIRRLFPYQPVNRVHRQFSILATQQPETLHDFIGGVVLRRALHLEKTVETVEIRFSGAFEDYIAVLVELFRRGVQTNECEHAAEVLGSDFPLFGVEVENLAVLLSTAGVVSA